MADIGGDDLFCVPSRKIENCHVLAEVDRAPVFLGRLVSDVGA
jgi:hypothetical protein